MLAVSIVIMHQRLTNKRHTQKEMFEALVDKLGIDPKRRQRECQRTLRKGFALYYKDTKEEEQRVIDGAVTMVMFD